ncbi:MAG TPA: hypothetical protein VKB13_07810 [Gaiellaceae bacterium]|nr:hypothetical protein [Gaiellaceae bacterium]
MAAVIEPMSRGERLLLARCGFLAERRPARARLETALGGDFARLLVDALCRGQGRFGSVSP